MNFETKNPVQQYLDKWANVNLTKKEMNLPQIKRSQGEVGEKSQKLGFQTSRREAFSPDRKLSIQTPSSKRKQCFSPRVDDKRNSYNQEKNNLLSDEDIASVETHLKMISKTKKIVEDAKSARFRGFFSPRVLRNKINNFAAMKDIRNFKNDFTTNENIVGCQQNIIAKPQMETLINKICKQKIKKIRIRTNIESDIDQKKCYPLKLVHRENSNDLPCNILCRA